MINKENTLQNLNHEDEVERRYAVEDLASLHDDSIIPSLVTALNDKSIGVREAVVDALVTLSNKDVCELVYHLLESESVSLRNYAIEILVGCAPTSESYLIKAAQSNSVDVRKFAFDAIRLIYEQKHSLEEKTFACVVHALNDLDENVLGSVIEFLGSTKKIDYMDILFLKLSSSAPWIQLNILFAMFEISKEIAIEKLNNFDTSLLSEDASSIFLKLKNGEKC